MNVDDDAIHRISDEDDNEDDYEDDHDVGHFLSWEELPHQVIDPVVTEPRRSSRINRGVNRNPGRLPVSVITGLPLGYFE